MMSSSLVADSADAPSHFVVEIALVLLMLTVSAAAVFTTVRTMIETTVGQVTSIQIAATEP